MHETFEKDEVETRPRTQLTLGSRPAEADVRVAAAAVPRPSDAGNAMSVLHLIIATSNLFSILFRQIKNEAQLLQQLRNELPYNYYVLLFHDRMYAKGLYE